MVSSKSARRLYYAELSPGVFSNLNYNLKIGVISILNVLYLGRQIYSPPLPLLLISLYLIYIPTCLYSYYNPDESYLIRLRSLLRNVFVLIKSVYYRGGVCGVCLVSI